MSDFKCICVCVLGLPNQYCCDMLVHDYEILDICANQKLLTFIKF